MSLSVETVPENLSLGRLADRVRESKHKSFPVVADNNHLTGMLSHIDYRDVIFDENLKDLLVAQDLATEQVVTVPLDGDLYDALQKITLKDYSLLPVVSSDDPAELVGVLSRRDIISAYNNAIIRKSMFEK
jgi:CIC family chloride channel protein